MVDNKFVKELLARHLDCPDCPTPEKVLTFFNTLLGILFPAFATEKYSHEDDIFMAFAKLEADLEGMIYLLKRDSKSEPPAEASRFFGDIKQIHDAIQEDALAIYEGDPAAASLHEVIKSYPGFYAIAAYRIAHNLYKAGIPLLPRMITELAHSKTGIDIHPGATIGKRFCIDHGTGIVIGETCVIGNNVKIYQGVTLGALSVNKEDAKSKRHPTIGHEVILYAGATVLGGKTNIGNNSIIGGNTWITESIPADSKIYYVPVINKNTISEQSDNLIIK